MDITDDGIISVSAIGQENVDIAIKLIEEITFEPQIGNIFEGTVVKILPSGAFINYVGSHDGFVHISEIADKRIESVNDELKEGQKVRVKLIGFDRGKAKLTIRNVDNEINKEIKKSHTTKKNFVHKKQVHNKNNDNDNATKDKEIIGQRKYFN